jgi:4-amino-4-deoxy-L-arabinose transferase-like glycosyltransferase
LRDRRAKEDPCTILGYGCYNAPAANLHRRLNSSMSNLFERKPDFSKPDSHRPDSHRPDSHRSDSRVETIWWRVFLVCTAANCIFQIVWFWRFLGHNITMDGIAYIGLARHLIDGNFKASLHGYWSPLTSWIIAAAALFNRNFTLLGRVVTIASFLICLPLLYLLTLKLWRSRVAAALAILWFSTARGIAETAIGSILADFVLTACVLLYFIVLMQALKRGQPMDWFWLGCVHGLTFLAKAIAMPWLAISSLLAVLVQTPRSPRKLAASLLLVMVAPAAIWLGWGFALRAKYGQFTPGYQLRANLLTNWKRSLSHHPRGNDLQFRDLSSVYDDYMVGEVSWVEMQSFRLLRPAIATMIVKTEFENLPAAAKEIAILLTPGGGIALAAVVFGLACSWRQYRAEAVFVGIVLISALSLVAAYCMLVFDTRYVIPIVALLIAVACPMLLPANWMPGTPHAAPWLQKTSLSLFVASTVFFTVYWASPFRTVDRDFEVSCYQAASILRNAEPSGTLVSIGNGPYPEHGVGFEAAPYTAYLAGWRVVGGNALLPDIAGADALADEALSPPSDAIVVWGSPTNPVYVHIVSRIEQAGEFSEAKISETKASETKVSDPYKGEVGTLTLRR